MFFKKKSKNPTYQDNPINFLLWRRDCEIEGVKDALPLNFAEKNFEYVAWNSGNAIESLLIKCALYSRTVKNNTLAIDALRSIKPFITYIEDAIARANEIGFTETNFVHVKNLVFPLLALLLSDDIDCAERLAKVSRLPVMQEEGLKGENTNPHDEIAKMLVAVVLDDKKAFLHAQSRYVKDKLDDRFFEIYFNYDRLIDLIFKRDSAAFGKALGEQEDLFLQRATDIKVDHDQILDGFLENNARVFDVWATALVYLARQRGMQVIYSSEVIPLLSLS